MDLPKVKSIIYIYGWGGGAHSKGLLAIQNHCGEDNVYSLAYNQLDPTENYQNFSLLAEELIGLGPVLVIGNSLGGYWANFLSENYPELETILINPSLFPEDTLSKYQVDPIHLAKYRPSTFQNKSKWIFLSKHDEVIDPMIAKEKFSDCNGITWLDESHAIQDYTFLESISVF